MTTVWSILGSLAITLVVGVVAVSAKDVTRHRFPRVFEWLRSRGGWPLVGVILLSVSMVAAASLALFMAASETTTGNRVFLWGLAAGCLLFVAWTAFVFRSERRRSTS